MKTPLFLLVCGVVVWVSYPAFSQSFDVEGDRPPVVGSEKVKQEAKSPSHLVRLKSGEKGICILDYNKKNGLIMSLSFSNSGYLYRLSKVDDSTVQLEIKNCAAKDCGEFGKQQSFSDWPYHFTFNIIFESETASFRVDIDKKAESPLTVQAIKSNKLIRLVRSQDLAQIEN